MRAFSRQVNEKSNSRLVVGEGLAALAGEHRVEHRFGVVCSEWLVAVERLQIAVEAHQRWGADSENQVGGAEVPEDRPTAGQRGDRPSSCVAACAECPGQRKIRKDLRGNSVRTADTRSRPTSLPTMPAQGRMQRGPQLPYRLLAGVVPCPQGWLVAAGKLVGIQVYPEEPKVMPTFRDVVDAVPLYEVIAVTLPIGLPLTPQRGGRRADHEAREILGFPHAGAIGSTPTRASLTAGNYAAARQANGGLLDVVTWQQFPKIREVDAEMEPYMQRRVYEVRPELSFYQLAEDEVVKHTKDSKAGQLERKSLLLRRMPDSERIIEAELDGVRLAHSPTLL